MKFMILLGLCSLGSYDVEDEKETECGKNLMGKLSLKFHLIIRQDIASVMYAILEGQAAIMDTLATAFRAVPSDVFCHQLCSNFEFFCSDGG